MFGGLAFTGNEANEGTFMGKTFPEWYDAAGKMMAGENSPALLGTLSKDLKIARIGTGAEVGIAVVGLAMDYAAYRRGDISATKFWVNQGASAVGILGGTHGAVAAGIYFGVDAFYPGGWNGVGIDISNSVSNTWNTFTQGISQYDNIYKWVPHQ